jgi:hypothetical protein
MQPEGGILKKISLLVIFFMLLLTILPVFNYIEPVKAGYDDTYIYAAGATTNRVNKYWKSNMTYKQQSAAYGYEIYALVQDDTYIYAGGLTWAYVKKYWKSNMTLKQQSADFGGAIWSLAQDETYIYAGGQSPRQANRYWKSNLTLKDSTTLYGGSQGIVLALCVDTDYLYTGGQSAQTVNQYWKTNLTKKTETANYSGTIWTMAQDDTYIYVGGATTKKVNQYWKSNMTLKQQSEDYGGTIYAIRQDDTYIYVGGATTQKVNQYWKSNMTLKQQSADYSGTMRGIGQDDTYIYAGGATTKKVNQYWKSNMTLKQQSADYGGTIYAIADEKQIFHAVATHLITPKDQATNINLQPKCKVWANQTAGATLLTINFYENSTGSWIKRQMNSSVTANTTVQWNYTQAIGNDVRYYWKTTISNGITNLSNIYYFTTKELLHEPSIHVIFPKNNTMEQNKQPNCLMWENNTISTSQTINFYENTTGAWIKRQRNVADSNEMIDWNYSQAEAFNRRYYWKVTVDDGTTNATFIFSFYTKNTIAPPKNVRAYMNEYGDNPTIFYINFTYLKSNTSTGTYARYAYNHYPTSITDGYFLFSQNDGGGTKISSHSMFTTYVFINKVLWISVFGYNGTLSQYGTTFNKMILSYSNATTNINASSATFHGYVTGTSTARAVYWKPGAASSNTTNAAGVNKSYQLGFRGLLAGQKYFYRMYAEDSHGNCSLGINRSFLTKPEAPTNVHIGSYTTTNINISWAKGIGCNNTIVVRKEGSIPSSMSDGSKIYNGAGEYLNVNIDPSHTYFYRLWSSVNWTGFSTNYSVNSTTMSNSAGLYINCYNETGFEPLTFNVVITNQTATQTYSATGCTNTKYVNYTVSPKGIACQVAISATHYSQRVYSIDILESGIYLLNAYIPYDPTPPSQNITYLYVLRIYNRFSIPLESVKIDVKKYMNVTLDYQTVDTKYTDAAGQADVYLIAFNQYQFELTLSGFVTGYSSWTPTDQIFYHDFILDFLTNESIQHNPLENITLSASFYLNNWTLSIRAIDINAHPAFILMYINIFENKTLIANLTYLGARQFVNYTNTATSPNITMHEYTIYLYCMHTGILYRVSPVVIPQRSPFGSGLLLNIDIDLASIFGEPGGTYGHIGWINIFMLCLGMFIILSFGRYWAGLGIAAFGLVIGLFELRLGLPGFTVLQITCFIAYCIVLGVLVEITKKKKEAQM